MKFTKKDWIQVIGAIILFSFLGYCVFKNQTGMGVVVVVALAIWFLLYGPVYRTLQLKFPGLFGFAGETGESKTQFQKIDNQLNEFKLLFEDINGKLEKDNKNLKRLNQSSEQYDQKLEKLNARINVYEKRLEVVEAESSDYHKSFQDLVYKITIPGISYVEKYKTPSEFQKLMDVVKSAKNDGYSVSDDSSYLECVKIVQGSIAYNLEMAIEFFYSQEQANEYKASIDDLSHIQPVPEKELHEIRKKIESKYGDRTELVSQFSQAISDLKKLQS